MHKNHPAARGVVLVILPIGEEAGDEPRDIAAQSDYIGNLRTNQKRERNKEWMGVFDAAALMEQRCEKVHCFHFFTSDSLHITAPG